MIILLTRKLYRWLVAVIIIVLAIPLLYFYLSRAVNPELVSYRKPQGEAVKVSVQEGQFDQSTAKLTRFQVFLHDFYQNGL